MATPHRKAFPRRNDAPSATAPAVAPWTLLLFQPLLDAQRLQWGAYLGWHRAVVTLHEDLWEQWAVHYGGGFPIDG
jgi:hypothetical protein